MSNSDVKRADFPANIQRNVCEQWRRQKRTILMQTSCRERSSSLQNPRALPPLHKRDDVRKLGTNRLIKHRCVCKVVERVSFSTRANLTRLLEREEKYLFGYYEKRKGTCSYQTVAGNRIDWSLAEVFGVQNCAFGRKEKCDLTRVFWACEQLVNSHY